jgi:hypothetical protein
MSYEAKLTAQGNQVAFTFPYDRWFVEEFKHTVSPADRRWDAANKVWWITPAVTQAVIDLCRREHLPVTTDLTNIDRTADVADFTIRVNYIGGVRDRGNGVLLASGMDETGIWRYRFPMDVLKAWFGDAVSPAQAKDYYEALGVQPGFDPAQLKTNYRRLVRQWHPDVCHEPGAADVFQYIQTAYQTLSDPKLSRRYAMAQQLAGGLPQAAQYTADEWGIIWSPPVHCGYLRVTGERKLDGVLVRQIHAWDDIVNGAGQIMVSSWPGEGGDDPVYYWIDK